MKNRKTMEALLLGALLVLAGCIEPTGGKSTVQPTAGLVAAEKDVVLKEAALVQPETRQVLGFDSSTGEITVAGDVAVKAGQVFHSGVTAMFPSGALKKVLAVKTLQESKKVLITEDAVLTDGIENGEYSAEGRLFLDGMRVDSPDSSLTMVDSPETAALLGNGENSSLTRRFDVKYSIGNNVSVTGSFQLTLPFSFMLDIKSSELKAFDISIEPKLDLDLDIRGSLNDRHTHRLGTLYLQPVTIGVVVISPVLEVSLSTAIDGVTEFGFQAKSEFLAGARYSGTTGRWIPYSDNNIDVEIEPPSLAGAVEASLGLKKELRLYGVAGPYFTPEIYAGLRGKSDGSKVSFSAYRGLRARAEGEVKRLGKNLPDLNFTLFDVRDDLELSNKTNMLPIAGFSYTKTETSPGVYRVNFSDGSTDEDGSIVSREWDFDGDGNTDSTDRNPSRTFSNVDTAVVKLTVRDNRMGSKSISRRLIPLAAYTVSFDANDGSSVSGQSVPEGGRAAEPDAPTRSGYVFRGWYSDSGLSNSWDFDFDTVNSALTLYAKWEEQEEIETLDESFEGGSLSSFWIGSWIIDSAAYSGSGSLKSNDIDNSQSAAAEVRVRVSLASEISFYRKVSSEDGYDKLSFYINGNQPPEASWSGSEEWAEMSYPIEPGVHTLKWVYEKDGFFSDKSDCAWIDDVSMKRGAINGLRPANGASTTDTTPTFSWNTVTGADSYEIQIAGSQTGLNSATADSVTGTTTTYTPGTALTNNTTHYWRVRAVDGKNQEGDWSTAHSLDVAIGAVSGLRPFSGTYTADTTPDFSWDAVADASGYEIQIAGSEAGLNSAAAVSVTGTTTTYTPGTALTNNTTHYWRVRAKDGDGQQGAWSTEHSLNVMGTVGGLSPSDGITTTDTTPALRWNAVSGAAGYEVQIAASTAGLDSAQAVEVSAASYTPATALTNLQTHYWQVRAKDANGQYGAWSAINSLSVNWGTVSGLSPSNGTSTTNTKPLLSWNTVTGAAGYEVQIAASTAGLDSAQAVEVSAASYTPSTALTNNTTHYWRVRAKDGDGQQGAWSTEHSLNVMGTVGGLSPSDGITTTDTTPALRWNAVSGAAGYEVQIAASTAGLDSAQAVEVSAASYTPATALTNLQTHYWQVRAKDANGQYGAWSAINSLSVNWGTVSGLSPSNGTSTTNTKPLLSWNTVTGAAGYEVQIAASTAGLDSAQAVEVSAASYTPSTALTNNTTHYWRVRAKDGDGQQGAWSTEHSLNVMGTVGGLSPSDGITTTDTTPALRWNAVSGAAGYEVQIAASTAGLDSAQAVEVSAASYTPATALTNLQTHYWQVRAKDANGQYGAWSAINSLSVNWGTVSGLSPSNGTSTTNTKPLLSWNTVTGAAGYEVQIAASTAGLDSAQAVEVSAASYTPSTALTNNTTHYWRVRAKDGDGQQGAWSTEHSLNVMGTVGGLSPSDGITTTDTTPALRWNAVSGAAGYEVQIAASTAGLDSAQAVEVSAASYTPATALTNLQTHYWQVRAKDANGQYGAWSAINSLSVNWGTVSGLSPSNGTSTTNTKPLLSWNTVTGAAGYEVQIAASTAGLDSAQAVEVSAASYTPSTALTNNTTHYWRVRAKDGDGQQGAWSTEHSLNVMGTVGGLSPSDGITTTDTTPALRWNAVSGAAGYEVQIAASTAGLDSAQAVEVSAASYTPATALTNLQTHYWQVRAKDANGQYGAWSAINSLSVNWGTVSGLSPSNGTSTTNTKPLLSWNTVTGAAGYEVQIAASTAGLDSAQAVEVSAASYTPSTALTNNTTHYWRVRAKDGDGQQGAWSTEHSLNVMGTVGGLSPSDGITTTDTTPALRWNAVSGAAGYEVQIAASTAGLDSAQAVEVSAASYTPATALTNLQTHYWQVRAKDANGQYGAWSAINSLSVNWGTVSGLSPSNGTSTTNTKPLLSWNTVTGAAGYEVQIAASTAGLDSAQAVEVSAASYTPSTALTNNTTHYWRVRAKDGDGQQGAWSTEHSLNVMGTVGGLSPSDGITTTDTTPALRWNAVSGAAGYEVQIAASTAGLDSAQAVEVSAASYTPATALTNLQTHYWQVRAKDANGQYGAWSAINSLSVNWGTVSGLSPSNGTSTTNTKPLLSWNTVTGAAGYEVQIAASTAGLDSAQAVEVSAASYTPSTALTNNTTHYWRVRAKDGDGQQGAWSTEHSLNVMGTVGGLSPSDGITTTDTTPALRWNAVSGAAGYEVQIAASTAGLDSAQAVEVSAASYTPATALTNLQTHYWQVRAKDANGQYGAWSAINSLSVNWGTVSGLSPSNGTSTTNTKPLLSWNTVTGAAGYEVQIAASTAGLDSAQAVEVSAASYTPSTALTNNTTHYWRVRAKDGDGQQGAWSTEHSLNVMGTVGGLSPSDGITTTDTTPALRWNAVSGAAGYEVQIAASTAGLDSAQAVEVSAASYTPATALTNLQTHYWQVRAKDANGQYGAWSAINSLSVNWGTVSGLSPSNGTSTTNTKPLLSWNTVTGAAGYEVQIAASTAGLDSAQAVEVSAASYTPSTALTNNTTHYWRVRAKDGDGQQGAWSTEHSLNVMGTVGGLSPSDGITTTDTTPALRWNAVSGAAGYEVQIAASTAGLDSAQAVEVSAASYTPATALTNLQTHYWQVRAKDANGQYGAWSAINSLSVNWGTVSGLSPSNGTSTTNTKPLLSWNTVTGAAGYEVQIAASTAGLDSAQAVEVSAASYTPSTALTNLQTHYWQVRAKDGDGQYGAWSAINSLSVNWGAVSGLSPSSTTDTTPALSWNAVPGAAGYEVQIADSEGGVANSVAIDVTDASYTPATALTNGQTHYWRVRAKDGAGQFGAWSGVQSLMIDWGTMNGLVPTDGSSTTDTTPALSWNAVPGAAGYELQIAESRAGVETAPATSVTGTSYTPTSALTNLQTHYWRVRAKDGDGQHGAWSAINSLSLNWGAVSGLSPANGNATTDTTPTFSWNTVEGAAGYELQIAESRAGVETAPATSVTGTSYTPTSALTNLQTHYWRVRALDSDDQAGSWSDAYSLMLTDGFVYVEGGTFQMGSTDGNPDENPVHQVTVSPFYMSRYEVTQGEWRKVMESSPSHFTGNDNRPVEKVSWYDAVEYCNKLSAQKDLTPVYTINGTSVTADWDANGYRLPTEAEWEYAARGGNSSEGYTYAGGNDVGEVAWYLDNSGKETNPVGGKAPNKLELYDMSGNVREWCWDWYDAYPSGSQSDPGGPASGLYRVNRGGSWSGSAGYLRSAGRYYSDPDFGNTNLGVRLVRRGF